MKITPICDYDNQGGMTQEEALAAAKAKGLRLLTNKEWDTIIQDDALRKEYYAFLPCWTGTHVRYKGTDCVVKENGKTYKMKIPEKDGWHEQNELGLPFGKPSERSNPESRYLWRATEHSGLLRRGYYVLVGNYRRDVYANDDLDDRRGVIGIKLEGKHMHKFKRVCECGVER